MKIIINKIQKSYKHKKVLTDVSFSAEEGNCVGILGSNGCGKSTLLSILAGVQRADGGSFLCGEEDLLRNSKLRSLVVGYVPQNNPLIEELTAWDNLRMWHSKEIIKMELDGGVLSMLGIDEFLKIPVKKMSGGMKKRLTIGCAVVGNPKILLLDEPSAALDITCKEKIHQYLKSYQNQGGILILTTHDTQEIEMCDKCYILKQGTMKIFDYDGDIHRLAGNL